MYATERLLLRGVDPERDLNELSQDANNAEFIDLMYSGPRVPRLGSQIKEQFKEITGGKLPFFAICLKSATPEADWPLNLKPDENYFTTSPPAIGFLSLQDKQFDYKNRVAYVGISFRDPQHRGKGFGSEVLLWLQKYAFEELGLHKLQLEVYSNNLSAMRCYEKVGFVHEGNRRKTYFCRGKWWDTLTMGILEEEYFARVQLENGTQKASK